MPGLTRMALLLLIVAGRVVVPAADEPVDLLGNPVEPAPTSEPAPASEPVKPAPASVPVKAKHQRPSAEAIKSATEAIKDLYKTEYSTSKGRIQLVSTLIDQAAQTNDDPAMRYALMNEARELAVVAKNIFAVLEVCEQLATVFEIESANELKRTALGRISGTSVVPHLVKLLDAPDDALANSMVGRWYASDVQQWDRALPLLAKGSDQPLAKAASSELALSKTAPAAEQAAVADQWYDLGKRTTTVKASFWRHALGLYELAKPRLSGLNVNIIEKRIAEIEAYLPLGPDADYNALSSGQWEKLQGKIITVDSSKGINLTTITVKEGEKIRVVPHPTDTWTISERGEVLTTNWKGGEARRRATGSLQCRIGDGIEQPPGIISGKGKLTFFMMTSRGSFDRKDSDRHLERRVFDRRTAVSGTIRVKILSVTE